MTQVFDPGLQPERTELAWRRTALSIAIGSLVALRLLPAAYDDPWWTLAGLAGLLVATAIWRHSRLRSHAVRHVLMRDGDRSTLPGAAPLLALAAFAATTGALALALVLTG